jgi:hypothetical protein
VPFSRWRLRYLACFSALVKAMDAVSGALQSVTGTYAQVASKPRVSA